MKISNWGNYPIVDAEVFTPQSVYDVKKIVASTKEIIVRGLGRCYGDSSLNTTILSTARLNRLHAFDEHTGIVTCEAGVSLEELLDIFVPRGWFLPVTPGTKFVTVGGAIASDVHGKNHHVAGSFSNHIQSMSVLLSDGKVSSCSKNTNSDLFWATCGGMGLTGIILHATIQLMPIETVFIRQETVKAKNLFEIMDIFESSQSWTYSVAWLDTLAKGDSLGRSILMRGEHAKKLELTDTKYNFQPLTVPKKLKFTVPFFFPNMALSYATMKAFNFAFYNIKPNAVASSIIDYDTFFYPLDSIHQWNKIYGKNGLTQYQFVLPKSASKEGLVTILNRISKSGHTSFLTVLKLFGKQEGILSFPMEGYNLSLDFPIRPGIFELLDELDVLVLHYGGRLYLAKDARMNSEMFSKSYANSEKFSELKSRFDSRNIFHSMQSRRIGL